MTLRPRPTLSKGVSAVEVQGEVGRNEQQVEGPEIIEEMEDQEARPQLVARKPKGPTKADIDAHYPLHAEYRDWCPHCVSGKGISRQHRQGCKDE